VQKTLYAATSASLRRFSLSITTVLFLFAVATGLPLAAQTTSPRKNATSGLGGAYITGPASNPLSFLNGAAWRTTGNPAPYDVHDFAPATYLDAKLPKWIDCRPRSGSGTRRTTIQAFKAKVDDSYLLKSFPVPGRCAYAQLAAGYGAGAGRPCGLPKRGRSDLRTRSAGI